MHSNEWGRKAVPIGKRKKQLFTRRRESRGKPVLVASTMIVSLALVFAIGFKFGKKFHDSTADPSGQMAAQVTEPASLESGAMRE